MDLGSGGETPLSPVTGISRSGRVRKKSSKLADFESPDDLDPRYKRKPSSLSSSSSPPNPPSSTTVKSMIVDERPPDQLLDDDQHQEQQQQLMDEDFEDLDVDDMIEIKEEDFENIPDIGGGGGEDEEEEDEDDDEDDDYAGEEGNLMIDDTRGNRRYKRPDAAAAAAATAVTPTTTQPIYFSEKVSSASSKKGQQLEAKKKPFRKDKGKSRFTAYMLWAKGVREEILRQNPGMEFASVSKRLGELWATVSASEKYNWKRRAKRLAAKGERAAKAAAAAAAAAAQPQPQNQQQQSGVGGNNPSLKQNSKNRAVTPNRTPEQHTTTVTPQQSGLYKVIGTEPIDTAAHLKLLGESLSIIGERLTEHEGQIAVSGSLSVLLDSLLCAMGPLICLTQQVPELNSVPQEKLNKILDNIAYIMPGL